MPRTVIPRLFAAFTGLQDEAKQSGLSDSVIAAFLQDGQDHSGVPVSVRWLHRAFLGFPRRPFTVFRRPPRFDLQPIAGNLSVIGEQKVGWGEPGMIRVECRAAPEAGATIEVDALDEHLDPIPGQTVRLSAPGRARLFGPGIHGLQVRGRGMLTAIRGMGQSAYANFQGWEQIEQVGLPVRAEDNLPTSAYDGAPQGPEPVGLDAIDAGERRMEIARLMHLTPPDTGVAAVPAPAWPAPDTKQYLFGASDGVGPLLKHVYDCVRSTDDTDPARQQSGFVAEVTVPGMRQIGSSPDGETVDLKLPVVELTLLAAASDTYASTGLGYGTLDFPPVLGTSPESGVVVPENTVFSEFDYMVVADFAYAVRRPGVGIVVNRLELAALAQPKPVPVPPAALTSELVHHNRPAAQDEPESVAIRLSWDRAQEPRSFAAVRSLGAGQVDVLNAPRQGAGGFIPYLAQQPPPVDGKPPAGGRSTLVDPAVPAPLTGNRTARHLLAALDMFGRWSSWAATSLLLTAPQVARPGLHGITLLPEANVLPDGTVPATLEIVFSWDWFQRRPARIVLRGRFFATGTPAPTEPNGLALRPTGPASPQVQIRFDPSTDQPSIASGHAGTVEVVQTDPPPASEPSPKAESSAVRRYRLVLSGLACDFRTVPEVGYAVFARAEEAVRPGALSPRVGPALDTAFDPIPPDSISMPADVQWTALPDAVGIARRVLEWPADPRARGYVVWRATESALRHRIDPALPPPAAGSSMVQRAMDLRDLLRDATNQARAAIAFTRLNTELVASARYEVELPGAADVLYVFQVTAVSKTNVAGQRSNDLAFVAVPRLNQPGEPLVTVRRVSDGSGLQIAVVPGRGATPVGYRVHRARNPLLTQDVGLMGPARIRPRDPGWANIAVPPVNGGAPLAGRAVRDPIAPSWYPYYYRVVALGEEDLPEGQIRGQSAPSATQTGLLPPAGPPRLERIVEARALGAVTSIAVGAAPRGVAFDERRGRVYVANTMADSISAIDVGTNSVVDTIPVGSGPTVVAVLPDDGTICVGRAGISAITLVDRATGSTREVVVGGRPSGVAVHEASRRVYVAVPSLNRVVAIDAVTGAVVATVAIGGRPLAVAVHAASDRVYVTSQNSDLLTVVDGTTHAVLQSVTVTGRPESVDVNPTTGQVYVTNRNTRSLLVFEGATLDRQADISLGTIPTEVRVDARTNRAYVSHTAASLVSMVDGETQTMIGQASVGGGPSGLAVHSQQGQVYVSQGASNAVAVLSLTSGALNRVFRLHADLPIRQTPLGEARLEVFSATIDPLNGRVQRTRLFVAPPHQIAEGPPLTVLPSPTPEELAAMPEVRRGPPDANGMVAYTVRVRAEAIPQGIVLVRAHDPLGRVAEAQLMEEGS